MARARPIAFTPTFVPSPRSWWRTRSDRARELWTGWSLLLPALVLVFGLVVYPIFYDLALALSRSDDYGRPGDFVGLANFGRVLASQEFRAAAWNSALYTFATSSLRMALGVGMALVLWQLGRRWRLAVFLALFVPWAFPAALSAFAFYWLLSPPFHTFYTLALLKVRFALADRLGQDLWHVGAIAVHDVWRSGAFLAIFLLAGLNSIPADQLDYASLECSGGWRRFWYVLFPLTRRFLVLGMLLSLVISFIDYTNVFVQTGGRITWPLVGTLAYRASFYDGNTDIGSAMTLIQLPVWFAILWVGFRLFEREPRGTFVASDKLRSSPRGSAPSREHETLFDAIAVRSRSALGSEPLQAPVTSNGQVLEQHASPASGTIPSLGFGATIGLREYRIRPRHALGKAVAAAWLRARGVLIVVFSLFPVWWIVLQAIRPVKEDKIGNPFWTWDPTLDGFLEAFEGRQVWIWMLNTGIVLVVGIALTLVASVLAGYALARLKVPGRRWIARALLASYFLPQPMVLVPIYQVFLLLHLNNTLTSVILLSQTLTIPFAAWLCYSHFETLPADIEEHAALDASRWQIFLRIMLPMSWAVIIAAGIFAAGVMMSDFVYAGLLLLHNDVKTIAVGLGIIGISLDEFNSITGGIGVAATPLVLACAAFAPAYVRGLSAAMVEGS